jgi:catechol 2,3-dioxygenase-like lactoylglutathione lyase family enzyme
MAADFVPNAQARPQPDPLAVINKWRRAGFRIDEIVAAIDAAREYVAKLDAHGIRITKGGRT